MNSYKHYIKNKQFYISYWFSICRKFIQGPILSLLMGAVQMVLSNIRPWIKAGRVDVVMARTAILNVLMEAAAKERVKVLMTTSSIMTDAVLARGRLCRAHRTQSNILAQGSLPILVRRSLYRTLAPMRLWLVHQALADVVKVAMTTLSIMADAVKAARAVRVAKGNTKKRNNEKGKKTTVAGWNSRKKNTNHVEKMVFSFFRAFYFSKIKIFNFTVRLTRHAVSQTQKLFFQL